KETPEEVAALADDAIRKLYNIDKYKATPEERAFVEDVKFSIATYVEESTKRTDKDGNAIVASELSLEQLRAELEEKTPAVQMAIFDQFLEWQDQAKKLTKSVTASKIDVEGKGKNITSLIVNNNIINGILDKDMERGELTGFESKLIRNGKDTFLNTYRKNALGFNYDIMRANPKYFLAAQKTVISTF